MKQEYFTKKIKDRLCSREREFTNPKPKKKDVKKKGKEIQRKKLLMMIGDRGFGIGSRIRGHLRYGGIWKQDRHARYTTVCITNENYTPQTCVYCFNKLTHARSRIIKQDKITYREIKGTFICYNSKCPSARHGRNTTSRDKVSALAIAISGMTTLLFQETLPVFSRTISHSNTELHNKTASFCTRSGVLAAREA
ncbi:hypothetical protein BD560DRAFT_416411 [Blakeslea trispora]|nr:hypothetical protein BD560DRAFT_416411 [Blakeslea trispora]